MLKTVFLGLVLGLTLGISLAGEVFSRIGMQPETYMLMLTGFLIAALIVGRGIGMLAAFIVLGIAVLQPDHMLVEYGFDKDLLLATLLIITMYPIIHRVMQS